MGVALVDFAVRQRQADRARERVVVYTDLALSPKSDREDWCKSGNNSSDRLDVLVHAIGTS